MERKQIKFTLVFLGFSLLKNLGHDTLLVFIIISMAL